MRVILAAAVLALLNVPLSAAAQTREFLDAPEVVGHLKIQWDATAKKFMFAIDEQEVFRELKPGMLFLTRSSIYVTYPRINPLQLVASGSINAADDPSAATISKLIEALTSVATTVGPAAPTARLAGDLPAGACLALVNADRLMQTLNVELTKGVTPADIRTSVGKWAGAITKGYSIHRSGPAAIRMGTDLIDTLASTFQTATTSAARTLAEMEEAEEGLGRDECGNSAKRAYQLVRLANPAARIEQLKSVRAAALKLKESLEKDYGDGKWIGDIYRGDVNYKVTAEIVPTREKMQNVTLNAAKVALKVDEVTGALSLAQEEAGAVAFTVRRYSPLVPEVGIGPVFGFIPQKKYGTTTNAAGQTVVGTAKEQDASISPAILVNMACRCELGPFITPMFQIGAVTSKDTPGILIGGGIRLFGAGKGDLALGGGVMVAWTKDLDTLKPGDVVTGTKDIEADLKLTANKPQARPYLVLQYKF